MVIVTTPKELMAKGTWDDFCAMKKWSVYYVNEGLCRSDERIELTEEEAKKLFILKGN